MKKIYFIVIALFFLCMLSGCGASKEDDVIEKFVKRINDANAYHIEGTFELINNEENYTYDINVDYKADENFKVNLINQTNNHEQIILRNNDGVYVKTQESTKQKIKCYLRCIHLL